MRLQRRSALIGMGVLLMAHALGAADAYDTWEECGPVQVIAGTDAVWVFVEVEQLVHLPGLFVSAPNRVIANRQVVLIADRSGRVNRIPVSIRNGATFHPNCSRLFVHDGRPHLLLSASATNQRSVFRWNSDHFELLPLNESEQLMRQTPLRDGKEFGAPKWAGDDGWSRLLAGRDPFFFLENLEEKHERGLTKPTFKWDEKEFELVVKDDAENSELCLRVSQTAPLRDELVVKYDSTRRRITSREFREIEEAAQQHGHPKDQVIPER